MNRAVGTSRSFAAQSSVMLRFISCARVTNVLSASSLGLDTSVLYARASLASALLSRAMSLDTRLSFLEADQLPMDRFTNSALVERFGTAVGAGSCSKLRLVMVVS